MVGMNVDAPSVAQRIRARGLTLDGTSYPLDVHSHDVEAVLLPVARDVTARLTGRSDRRRLVGISGPPGAGKSAFAALLGATIDVLAPELGTVVVPLDGFHYASSYLDSHTGPDHDGAESPLRPLKGWHTSFDGDAALNALQGVRRGDALALPEYSRDLHDPVPDAIHVSEQCRVVIVEGNWLYLDVEPWRSIRELFGVRGFVTAERAELERRLLERHVRGGKSRTDALRHIERLDRRNIEAVEQTRPSAEFVVDASPGGLRLATI